MIPACVDSTLAFPWLANDTMCVVYTRAALGYTTFLLWALVGITAAFALAVITSRKAANDPGPAHWAGRALAAGAMLICLITIKPQVDAAIVDQVVPWLQGMLRGQPRMNLAPAALLPIFGLVFYVLIPVGIWKVTRFIGVSPEREAERAQRRTAALATALAGGSAPGLPDSGDEPQAPKEDGR